MRTHIRIVNRFFPAVVGLALVGVAAPVGAVVLAPTDFRELAGVAGETVQGANNALAETVTVTLLPEHANFSRGDGTATSSTSNIQPLLVEGSVSLQGKDSPAGFGGAFDSRIFFQFTVETVDPLPEPPALVPVEISSSGAVSVDISDGDSGNASAIFSLEGLERLSAKIECGAAGCNANSLAFDDTIARSYAPDTVVAGEIRVLAQGQGTGLDFFFDAEAFVDPTVTILPEFADHFRIVFGPGTVAPSGGGSSVPEPATFGLFALGIAGLAIVRRRRRVAA